MIRLTILNKAGMAWAKIMVERYHYLHAAPHPYSRPFGCRILVDWHSAGLLLFGRIQSTYRAGWYGSVEDVAAGRVECTQYQVLNLSRVWIDPKFQPGGKFHYPATCPGFIDRKGVFRSTLASGAIQLAMQHIGLVYLLARPPVFLDEPYEIKWLLSYCDTRIHRGVVYRQSGFAEAGVNDDGIQTWRIPLPGLSAPEHERICAASALDRRANQLRSKRAQLAMGL